MTTELELSLEEENEKLRARVLELVTEVVWLRELEVVARSEAPRSSELTLWLHRNPKP